MNNTVPTPALSVIIPVFNEHAVVHRAIDSVLSQGVADLEIILVDDGSVPAIKAEGRAVEIIAHQRNRGAAAARNTGMKAARAPWIAFLDADDVWLPGSLAPRFARARAAAEAGEHPLTVHVAGFAMSRPSREMLDVRVPVGSRNPLDFASGCWFSPGSTALFRREPLLTTVGGQDEQLRRFEDNDWFLRIALAGGGINPSPPIAALIHQSGGASIEVVRRNGGLILDKHRTGGEQGTPQSDAIVRRLEAWWALERAAARWYAGERGHTAVALAQSLWLAPRTKLHLSEFWDRHSVAPDAAEFAH